MPYQNIPPNRDNESDERLSALIKKRLAMHVDNRSCAAVRSLALSTCIDIRFMQAAHLLHYYAGRGPYFMVRPPALVYMHSSPTVRDERLLYVGLQVPNGHNGGNTKHTTAKKKNDCEVLNVKLF